MHFEPFLDMQAGLRNNTTGAAEMTFLGKNNEEFRVMYRNDLMPRVYTTFDDHTFLFDSYDSTVDTTLQQSKTMCMGVIYPQFLLEDTFTPDLDASQFSLLKNRAKVRAFAELKQTANQEAATESNIQKLIVQKRKLTTPDWPPIFNLATRYGRKGINTSMIKTAMKQGV
jgi:hypothetical protein